MARGVKRGEWSAEVFRQRTYRRRTGVETYALRFSYTDGDQHIDVAFRGHPPHDVINVYDHATGTVTVANKREVKALVNEYMLGMDSHDLRAWWENRPAA